MRPPRKPPPHPRCPITYGYSLASVAQNRLPSALFVGAPSANLRLKHRLFSYACFTVSDLTFNSQLSTINYAAARAANHVLVARPVTILHPMPSLEPLRPTLLASRPRRRLLRTPRP